MGKSKKKGGKKGNEEFFDKMVAAPAGDAWQTGPVGGMDVGEDDFVPVPEEPKAGTSGKHATKGMEVDGKPSKGIKLGVKLASMKRGQRTANQRIRKAKKMEKAVARNERQGIKVQSQTARKQAKAALKHVYD